MVAGTPPKLTVLVLVESASEEQVWRQVHGRLYSGGAEQGRDSPLYANLYWPLCAQKRCVYLSLVRSEAAEENSFWCPSLSRFIAKKKEKEQDKRGAKCQTKAHNTSSSLRPIGEDRRTQSKQTGAMAPNIRPTLSTLDASP